MARKESFPEAKTFAQTSRNAQMKNKDHATLSDDHSKRHTVRKPGCDFLLEFRRSGRNESMLALSRDGEVFLLRRYRNWSTRQHEAG